MHADVHGAATVVIRNYMSIPAGQNIETNPHCAVSLLSLQQAAVFSLCHSVSWDNNLINKVYWVNAQQVSKTAPTGEYLPTGSFMIRGKKNYMTPFRLEMGLCLLFQVSEESMASHRYERRRRDLSNEEWDEVLAKGCVSGVETAVDKLVEDDGIEDEEYSIEVMDTVTKTSKKVKPVVRVQQTRKTDGKTSKKSLKGTTKKSRAAAEERAEMEALAAEEENKMKSRSKELSRSERRKQKKAKKYEGRDEEDRKILEVLYGHASIDSILKDIKPTETPVVETPEVSVTEMDPAEALLQELMQGESETNDTMCYTCGSKEHDQRHCPESWRVIEGIEDGLVEKEDSAIKEKEEEDEKEEDKAEAAAAQLEREQRDTADFLLDWTYTPHADDVILHAIPVCAPYMAISEYAYRVKLTNGKMKKGAMAKSIVEMWLHMKSTEGEKRAIKQLPIEDLSAIILNNSKAILSEGMRSKK